MVVFLVPSGWLNMTAMVPVPRCDWVSGRYRFVSVCFSLPPSATLQGWAVFERAVCRVFLQSGGDYS